MPRSGINRGFMWLRKVLRVTEETESPSTLSELVRPTMDVFGWERLAPGLIGDGPQVVAGTGAAATDIVVLGLTPDNVMRYVTAASMSTDDPAGLIMSIQLRTPNVDLGIEEGDGVNQLAPQPWRLSLKRPILLAPGEQLIGRSVPAPAPATSLFIRMRFVDIDLGEYLPAI